MTTTYYSFRCACSRESSHALGCDDCGGLGYVLAVPHDLWCACASGSRGSHYVHSGAAVRSGCIAEKHWHCSACRRISHVVTRARIVLAYCGHQ